MTSLCRVLSTHARFFVLTDCQLQEGEDLVCLVSHVIPRDEYCTWLSSDQ